MSRRDPNFIKSISTSILAKRAAKRSCSKEEKNDQREGEGKDEERKSKGLKKGGGKNGEAIAAARSRGSRSGNCIRSISEYGEPTRRGKGKERVS